MLGLSATTARLIRVCAACRAAYGADVFCYSCLRSADADASKKRAILFPVDFAELT
jgi:hypothetical protein